MIEMNKMNNAYMIPKILTLIEMNDPTGRNVEWIRFSGAQSIRLNEFCKGDKFQFKDNNIGLPNIRFLKLFSHKASKNPVQFSILNDTASDNEGRIMVNINPKLISDRDSGNANITHPLYLGMKFTILVPRNVKKIFEYFEKYYDILYIDG